MKKIAQLFLLLFPFLMNAQSLQLSGVVVDSAQNPISDVTVLLFQKKDSTLLQFTSSSETGAFILKFDPINEPAFVTYDLTTYQTLRKDFESLVESKNLGNIVLKEDTDLLSEIVIVSDAPIRVKNDTLEFNASSFKVRPDANVEALLKELPGVEIDADKKITVNGKEVSQILVNGKPFFNRDGSIALQNLPADIIKKIQVTDHKTKSEEFSGRRAQSDNASINITIDEENNKGLMGKIMAGYGTDERYESSGLLNYFKGNRKISVLAASNNINSSGFSMDEIFDNMGGGRSQFFSYGGRSGGFGGFRSNTGITKSNMVGVNYSDQFINDLEVNASYYLNDTSNENSNRTRRVNFLPDGDFITESASDRINDNTNHNANFNFEYSFNPTTKIYIEPSISYNKNTYRSQETSMSMDEAGNLFNESSGNTYTDATSFTFGNSIEFNKKLDENGKNLSVNFNNNNSVTDGVGFTQSETLFYQGDQVDDIRNQNDISRSTSDTYTATAKYSHPLAKDMFIDLGYTFDYNNQTDELNIYNKNEITNGYTDFNERLSNSTHTEVVTNTPFVGYNIQNDKIYFSVNSGVNLANFNAKALYMGNEYQVDKNYVSPFVNTNFRYSFTRSKSFSVRYNYRVSNPSASQILPYERLHDPLHTYIGNQNLDQVKYHNASIHFRDYNFQMRSGWSVGLNANVYDSQIVSATVYDENRKRTTSYENLSGNYSLSLYGNWSKSHKWDEHKFRYGVGMYTTYSKELGYANGIIYNAKNISFNPRVYINYDYGDLLTIAPSYGLSINQSNYENYTIDQTNYYTHNLMLQTTTYWPENWVWGNDFSYNHNSNISAGFRKDYFLWNTSLAYTFLNKTLTAKVKVYDILNQNIGISRSLSATGIVDQENVVLKRYAMFSLTWKFDKFGTRISNERDRGEGGRMRSYRRM